MDDKTPSKAPASLATSQTNALSHNHTQQQKQRWLAYFSFWHGVFFFIICLPFLDSSLASISNKNAAGWVSIFSVVNYALHISAFALLPYLILNLLNNRFSHPLVKPLAFISYFLIAALLICDSQLFRLYQTHINHVFLNMFLSEDRQQIFELSNYELTCAALIFVGLFALQLLLSFLINHLKPTRHYRLLLSWGVLFCYSYVFLFVCMINKVTEPLQQVSFIPLQHQFRALLLAGRNGKNNLYDYTEHYFSQPSWHSQKLDYPKQPLQCKTPTKPYNIVLIVIDALRPDVVNNTVMPTLEAFKQQNIQFNAHYSGGNATQPGMFSLFYSLPSQLWTTMLNEKKAPLFYQQLRDNHYQIKSMWSASVKYPPYDQTVLLNLENFESAIGHGKGKKEFDQYITQQAIDFIKQPHQQPFYLNLFYTSSHSYCKTNDFDVKFKPIANSCNRLLISKFYQKDKIFNRYRNTVHYVDKLLKQVLQQLRDSNLEDNTIIMITSDHGQQFNDEQLGYWGHASNFSDYQLHVPLIVHWPGRTAATIDYPTSHYDIMPTLFQRVFACQNPTKHYSIGEDLFSPASRFPILVGSYANLGMIQDALRISLQRSGQVRYQNQKGHEIRAPKNSTDIIKQGLIKLYR